MINTLIFDLDGTLLNTLEDLKNATNFALKKFGYPERSRCSTTEPLAHIISTCSLIINTPKHK